MIIYHPTNIIERI